MPEEIKDAGSWNGFLYHKDKLVTLRKPLLVTIPQLLDLLTALTGMNDFVVEGLFEFYEHLNDAYTELLKRHFVELSEKKTFPETIQSVLQVAQSDEYISDTDKRVMVTLLAKYRKLVTEKYVLWGDDLSVLKQLAPDTYTELMNELLGCVSQKEVKEAIEITFARAWVHGNLKAFSDMLSTRKSSRTDFCEYGGFAFDTAVKYMNNTSSSEFSEKAIAQQ